MLEVLRLQLIELPEEIGDVESMERISRHFAEGTISQHMRFNWSAYYTRPSNVGVRFLPAIVLTSIAYLSYRFCLKNPAALYKRVLRVQWNRFQWLRIPRDDSNDFSSRSVISQPDVSQSLGASPCFNSIFKLKEVAASPASMSKTPRRDSSMRKGMRVKGRSLPQEDVLLT